jgi:Trk-type K+ transport system membrane component
VQKIPQIKSVTVIHLIPASRTIILELVGKSICVRRTRNEAFNGTLFNQVDELLVVTAGLILLLIAALILHLDGGDQDGELATPFAWIFATAMALNGLGHVGIMVVRRRHFPGGWTAFLLLALSAVLILRLLGLG